MNQQKKPRLVDYKKALVRRGTYLGIDPPRYLSELSKWELEQYLSKLSPEQRKALDVAALDFRNGAKE